MKHNHPVLVVENSRNTKIGDASATYAPMKTCPDTCIFLNNGCYAQGGFCHVKVKQMARAAEGMNVYELAAFEADGIRSLTGEKPLRLHVTGDCKDGICTGMISSACMKYIKKHNNPVWGYTHNWRYVDRNSWRGVSIMASCETSDDVLEAYRKGYVASITSSEIPNDGRFEYVVCPSQSSGKKCVDCRLCLYSDRLLNRKIVIFHIVHGHRSMALGAIAGKQQLKFAM